MSSTKQEYSKAYLENIELYKKDNPKLTFGDIQAYNINRENYFAGTIAVCVIYGVFSLILLLLTVFSPTGSQLVTDIFRTFTITFIIGMIIATILLTIAIVTYKPSVLTVNPYDAQVCPDYWQLEKTKNDDTDYVNATAANKTLMEYKCVNKNNLGNNSVKPVNKSENDSDDKKALYTYTQTAKEAKNYGAPGYNSGKVDCQKVYPLLLNSVNSTNPEINSVPNALACLYKEQCGVSWSAMCPNGTSFVP